MLSQHLMTLYVLYAVYSVLLVCAAVYDLTKFIIPNTIVVGIAALFFIAAITLPLDVSYLSHFGAAALIFAVGALLHRFRLLGGGDVKLLTAVSLWAGFGLLPSVLLNVALLGGALSLVLVFARRVTTGLILLWPNPSAVSRPRLLMIGAGIPYGVAIASAAIIEATRNPLLGLYL